MKAMTTADLSAMEVINLCDGARLGCPDCFELDCSDGSLTALLVPQKVGFSLFGKTEYYRIPWCKIHCIGEDTILINLRDNELSACACQSPKGKRGFFG